MSQQIKLLSYMRELGSFTADELAEASGANKHTVHTVLNRLSKASVLGEPIVNCEAMPATGPGRRPYRYSFTAMGREELNRRIGEVSLGAVVSAPTDATGQFEKLVGLMDVWLEQAGESNSVEGRTNFIAYVERYLKRALALIGSIPLAQQDEASNRVVYYTEKFLSLKEQTESLRRSLHARAVVAEATASSEVVEDVAFASEAQLSSAATHASTYVILQLDESPEARTVSDTAEACVRSLFPKFSCTRHVSGRPALDSQSLKQWELVGETAKHLFLTLDSQWERPFHRDTLAWFMENTSAKCTVLDASESPLACELAKMWHVRYVPAAAVVATVVKCVNDLRTSDFMQKTTLSEFRPVGRRHKAEP